MARVSATEILCPRSHFVQIVLTTPEFSSSDCAFAAGQTSAAFAAGKPSAAFAAAFVAGNVIVASRWGGESSRKTASSQRPGDAPRAANHGAKGGASSTAAASSVDKVRLNSGRPFLVVLRALGHLVLGIGATSVSEVRGHQLHPSPVLVGCSFQP